MYEAEKYALGFECGIQVDDKFWFSDMRENALYCWKQDEIKYMGEFLQETGERLYSDVKAYENRLIFVPLLANKIAIYDLQEHKFDAIFLPFNRADERGLFSTSIIWNGYLYLFPLYFAGIVKMNLQNGNMELVENFGLQDSEVVNSLCAPYFRSEYCQIDDRVYIPFMSNGALLEFDLSNDIGRFIDLGAGKGFSSIARSGDDFWLCSRMRCDGELAVVVRWDRLNNMVVSYPIDLPQCSGVEAIGSICNEEYCWIFLSHANLVLKVKLETGEIREEELFSDICKSNENIYSTWGATFIYCQKYENGVLLCEGRGSRVIWFETESGKLKSWSLKMPKERRLFYKETIAKRYNVLLQNIKEKDICYESVFLGPIDMVASMAEKAEEQKDFASVIGKKIFKSI